MKLGFTGTREEPTQEQIDWLTEFFRQEMPEEFHHGACVGSDAKAHRAALKYNMGGRHEWMSVVVHPPIDTKLMMPMGSILSVTGGVTILEPKPYLARNRNIVDATDRLVAFALEGDNFGTIKSGTWHTVRYAKAQNKPVDVVYPDGKVVRY